MVLRSFLPELFYKIGVLKDFDIFPGKHLCCGFIFNKIAGVACKFYKRDCIIVNFAKLLKKLFWPAKGCFWILHTFRTLQRHIQKQNSKHKYYLPHVFIILLPLKKLFGSHLFSASRLNTLKALVKATIKSYSGSIYSRRLSTQ